MYLLEHVGMDLFHVLLMWTLSWVGGAVLSNHLGGWAERFGPRPVLVLCTAFKSINMIGLLACPPDPTIAFWVLSPVFMIDAFLNAGIAIANNGFMIKNSPRENRTMFIAAGAGFAGVLGGVASIVAGAAIATSADWSWMLGDTQFVNFHVLFAISMVLRLSAAVLATQVSEPSSTGTRVVAGELLLATRMRIERLRVVFTRRGELVELTEPRNIPFKPRVPQPPAEPLSRRSA
jgi:MFS family permease